MRSCIFLLALFGAFLMSWEASAQRDVVVLEEKANKQIKLFLFNKTKEVKDVTLDVQVSGCTTTDSTNISRRLGPGEKSYAMTLQIVGGSPCLYRPNLVIKGETNAGGGQDATAFTPTPVSELIENKVNIFTKKGCVRCAYVVARLKEKNIPFKQFDTSSDAGHNALMFLLLRQVGWKKNAVDMPVVVANGKIEYNLADLDAWVNSIR